jgi:UDP-N-acetylmuramoyl-L-alanyl-D-glutamate--2,6-diaminopimelate ligase
VDPTLPPVAAGALAAETGLELIAGDPAAWVRGVVLDSHDVTPGALFCCVPGAVLDGHAFAPAAVAAGATALLVEHPLDLPVARPVAQLLAPSVRAAMGPVSAAAFGHPADDLLVAAVTGTNGKTTVTYLLEAILRAAGLPPGLIGTTGARVDGEPVALARTTPEAPDLHRLLRRMRDSGVRAVAIEVSSHALAQDRVAGLRADAAVFTNLSQDHLDYHGTMDAYFEAKARLFRPELALRGAVNVDDRWGRRLCDLASVPILTFSGHGGEADLRADAVRVDAAGVAFRVRDVEVSSPLRGAFNVDNVLAALAAAHLLGIDLHEAAAAVADVPGVPGRMEVVTAASGRSDGVLVMVDYAHTPDSIRSVLRGARPLTTGRVIVVFGCGGDRDRAKRPLMGRAATADADLTVVTTDNPRGEDAQTIVNEIVPGAREGGGAFLIELDRRAAIALAVREASPGDVVVIAGKGHEAVQELATHTVPFDDRVVAAEELDAARSGRGR